MGIPAAQALAWVWNAAQPQRAKTPRSGNTLNPQGFAKDLARRFVANAVSGLPGAIPTVRRMMRCSSVILFIVVLIAASQSRSDLKYCTLHAVSSACFEHTVWLAIPRWRRGDAGIIHVRLCGTCRKRRSEVHGEILFHLSNNFHAGLSSNCPRSIRR